MLPQQKIPSCSENLPMDYNFFSANKKRTILDQCVRCGICLGICPVYHISRLETDSPRGRLELMRFLAGHKVTSYYECKASFFSCLFCLQCQRNCPAGVEFDLSFFRIMELLAKTNNHILKDLTQLRGSRSLQLPSLDNRHLLEENLKEVNKGLENAVIFSGCFIELKEIRKIHGFLKDKGIDTIMILENLCCGLPYLLEGNKKEALGCMEQNMDILQRMKIKSLFTLCPFCLKMFTNYYPLFLNQAIKIEFKHICNLFSSIEQKPGWKLSKKVAYHSPCLLDQKTASNHRQIIIQLAGESYISLPEQICCGHGFGLPYIKEELSKQICQGNLSKIKEKGVQTLITDCPSCTKNWIKGVQEKNLELEVIPFWDLVMNLIDS